MTKQELFTLYTESKPHNNFRCDGEHCTEANGIVRIIPIDNSCNVHLCKSCYQHELTYNEDLELEGKERILPDLPFFIYPVKFDE